jgi:hypothetical protein
MMSPSILRCDVIRKLSFLRHNRILGTHFAEPEIVASNFNKLTTNRANECNKMPPPPEDSGSWRSSVENQLRGHHHLATMAVEAVVYHCTQYSQVNVF